MCTLALAWQVLADAPVAVAANRDESVDRPSTSPGIYREDPLIVAPRDADAGGTWIGYNEFGVLVAVTNRWTRADLAGERSRGLLVADALACESTARATALVERATAEREYDGFNLVVADADEATYLEWDGTLTTTALEPGVHVVVNVGRAGVDVGGHADLDGGNCDGVAEGDPDGVADVGGDDVDVPPDRTEIAERQARNAERVQAALEVESGERAGAWLERGAAVLGDHEYGVCIHGDGFGTRSSSLIALGDHPTFRYADGPPCRTAFEPVAVESHI